MDSKIDQGIPCNLANIALYQQLLNQQSQPLPSPAYSHPNYIQQTKPFDPNSSSSVNTSLFSMSNENLVHPIVFNMVSQQQSTIKDGTGMHIFAPISQQNTSEQQNILQMQQISQTKNILPNDVQYHLITNNFMQPALQHQIPSQQQQVFLAVKDNLPGLPLIQPAQLTNSKQDMSNINNLLQNLNIQNETSNNQQKNLYFLIPQQQQQQQQQQQFFQNPQLIAHQNLLNQNHNYFISSAIQNNNQQLAGKDLNLISSQMNEQLLQKNNQNQLYNQQLQQINVQLLANQPIMPFENQSLLFNKAALSQMELKQKGLISQLPQQQIIMMSSKNMEANQNLLASSTEEEQLPNQESQNQNEQSRQNIQNYKNLLIPLQDPKSMSSQNKIKQGIYQNSEDISSSTTISNSQKGLLLNNQYSNTLSPQRYSNPSIQSMQQFSSLTQINQLEKIDDSSNLQTMYKPIASLKDIDINDLPFGHNQIYLQQKLIPVLLNSDSQNNKIVATHNASNEMHNNLQNNLQNKSLTKIPNQQDSVDDIQFEDNRVFSKQKFSGDRVKNESLNRLVLSSQSSSSSSPLKSKVSKKEEKNIRKQNIKMYQNPLNSEHISSAISDQNSKESKDNKIAKTRNNEDPYKNYGYDSQIKNQLRKQVLKCFFKNVSSYVDKSESVIARLFPNLDKNALKSLCKYWSQFDNPTKRENLKNDEYKSLCLTLGINSEIKPLGQKSIKEVFCIKNDFSEGLKFLFTQFNDDKSIHSKKQKQKKMKDLYIETSEEILDDILGRQRKKKDGSQNKDTD